MAASIFQRPPRVRQTLNTQQQGGVERYVTSEDELRRAIGEVAARFSVDASGFPVALGGSIVIAKTFTVKAEITIPPQASLLSIRALSGCAILPDTLDQGTLFNVQAAFIKIRDLFVFYKSTAGTPTSCFNIFVELEDVAAITVGGTSINVNPENCHVTGCTFYGDRLFVDGSGGTGDDARIIDNWMTEANGSHSAALVFDSSRCAARGNTLSDGGGDTVTLSTNASECMIIGNDCGNGDITSSASGGYNVISGNVRTGALAWHGTDAVGLNT